VQSGPNDVGSLSNRGLLAALTRTLCSTVQCVTGDEPQEQHGATPFTQALLRIHRSNWIFMYYSRHISAHAAFVCVSLAFSDFGFPVLVVARSPVFSRHHSVICTRYLSEIATTTPSRHCGTAALRNALFLVTGCGRTLEATVHDGDDIGIQLAYDGLVIYWSTKHKQRMILIESPLPRLCDCQEAQACSEFGPRSKAQSETRNRHYGQR
jgi:hypothetical protein